MMINVNKGLHCMNIEQVASYGPFQNVLTFVFKENIDFGHFRVLFRVPSSNNFFIDESKI